MKHVRNAICLTVGCGSVFMRWFHWPYQICQRMRMWDRD